MRNCGQEVWCRLQIAVSECGAGVKAWRCGGVLGGGILPGAVGLSGHWSRLVLDYRTGDIYVAGTRIFPKRLVSNRTIVMMCKRIASSKFLDFYANNCIIYLQ